MEVSTNLRIRRNSSKERPTNRCEVDQLVDGEVIAVCEGSISIS